MPSRREAADLIAWCFEVTRIEIDETDAHASGAVGTRAAIEVKAFSPAAGG